MTRDGVLEDYCANESTTSIFLFSEQNNQYSLLYTFNCLKRGKNSNYTGSSKAMEKQGTEEIIKMLKKREIIITHYIHDADASTSSVISSYYPNSIEYIGCTNKDPLSEEFTG